jgi:hypothetical protein
VRGESSLAALRAERASLLKQLARASEGQEEEAAASARQRPSSELGEAHV